MRLLICAGGTGGGVYPALAILQALGKQADPVLWVGGIEGMEADLVQRAGLAYRAIPAAGVHGVGLRTLPGNILKLMRGYFASRRILKQFAPDVLLFTGGYVAIPMAFAGRKFPSLVYVPDIEPGLALKTLSRYADTIAITAEESRRFYKKRNAKLVLTGYPIRTDLDQWTKDKGRQHFHFTDNKPVFLVVGGSKGARSINRAVLSALEQLLAIAHVIHITGQLDWQEIKQVADKVPMTLRARYHVYPYLHDEMGAALAAADLALSRSGASTLGEYPFFGLPAVLVPYPYSWRYQKVNADHLVKNGAALLLENEKLPQDLLPTVLSLLAGKDKLRSMSAAMRSLFIPKAAASIGELLCKLTEKGAA